MSRIIKPTDADYFGTHTDAVQVTVQNGNQTTKLSLTDFIDRYLAKTADLLSKSNIHHGKFNAGNITEEGWYDSVTLGRPEGSESDEKYFLYQSSNGGQMCFSRRNSGKAYHRLGKEHPWMPITRDDYIAQQIGAKASVVHKMAYTRSASNFTGGTYYDDLTHLMEVYAGNNLETTVIDLRSQQPWDFQPHDIIAVPCFYRRGFSRDGVDTYPYDSDAYIYVSDSPDPDHSMSHLCSDFVKVKSMGGQKYPFTEKQKNYQDLALCRDVLFAEGEYYMHYLSVNIPSAGSYYVHIHGNFSTPGSWFVLDQVKVYRRWEDIDATFIDHLSIRDASGTTGTMGRYARVDFYSPNNGSKGTFILKNNDCSIKIVPDNVHKEILLSVDTDVIKSGLYNVGEFTTIEAGEAAAAAAEICGNTDIHLIYLMYEGDKYAYIENYPTGTICRQFIHYSQMVSTRVITFTDATRNEVSVVGAWSALQIVEQIHWNNLMENIENLQERVTALENAGNS